MCCSAKKRSLKVTLHCHVVGREALELYLHSPIRLHDVTCALLVVSKKKKRGKDFLQSWGSRFKMQNCVDSFWPENSSASQSVSLYLSLILIAYSNSLLFPYSGAELSKASRIANEHINSSSRKESTASLAEPPSNLTRLMLISFYEMHRFFLSLSDWGLVSLM